MANITFIVGNGLDLSLGLKTRYTDFYKYVQNASKHSENKIYNEIKDNPDSWSDFEKQLGAYTSYIKNPSDAKVREESINFHNELEQVRNDLADYLIEQENEIKDLSDRFGFNPGAYNDGLPSAQVPMIHNILHNGRSIKANFITLNYTTTLEKILEDQNVFRRLGWTVAKPFHIHGDVYENMTLGVSSESQLYEGMTQDEKDDLIKLKQLENMNENKVEDLQSIINGSRVIVVFGSSLGETDEYLWARLGEWLRLAPERRLVIHKRVRDYSQSTRRSPRAKRLLTRDVQDTFLDRTELITDQKEDIRNQVLVAINSEKLFYEK